MSTPAPSSDRHPSRDRQRLFAVAALLAIILVAGAGVIAFAPDAVPEDTAPVAYHVNVNAAGVDELQLLPGVGPSLAQRIVDSRESDGPFRFPDDLKRVSGIADKIVHRLTPYVRFE